MKFCDALLWNNTCNLCNQNYLKIKLKLTFYAKYRDFRISDKKFEMWRRLQPTIQSILIFVSLESYPDNFKSNEDFIKEI